MEPSNFNEALYWLNSSIALFRKCELSSIQSDFVSGLVAICYSLYSSSRPNNNDNDVPKFATNG